MIENAAEALGELPPTAALELMRRRRQIVVPDDRGDCPQRPDRLLQPGDERFERLARREAHVGPATEAENPFKQQMGERVTLNGDAQPARIGEVEGALASGDRGLLEV